MTEQQRKRLEAAGWKFGSATDFLGLTADEIELVEIKLRLAHTLKRCRDALKVSQDRLARALRSSQSRVAKMEAADRSVSMDLLMQALLALGVSRNALAEVIGAKSVKDVARVKIRPHLPTASEEACV